MSLSNKTDEDTLVKLLRICAFLESNQITGKLLGYLKPRIANLGNQELSQVFQALCLLPPQDPTFIKTAELLALRRIHSFQPDQLAQIFKSYSLLFSQRKVDSPSLAFI